MVQTKHKKPHKAKKQDAGMKHGKQTDITQFRSQLDALGLKIIQVTADGNCFFRAVADQLEGNEEEHKKYRLMVVQYILKHREEFEAFIEDEVPFDEYCKSMEEDGTWAGHMELQAVSLVTRSNICIHRFMSPRWYIRNFSSHDATMIHLSYHDGEHYNSIHLKEDSCRGPAKPIVIKMDADISTASNQAKEMNRNSKVTSNGNIIDMRSIKMVMSGTGCENYSEVEQVLNNVDGDVDIAIEYLIAEQGTSEVVESNDEFSSERNISYASENGNCEETIMGGKEVACQSSISSNDSKSSHDLGVQNDDKKKSKDKKCPPGSKRRQKMNILATGSNDKWNVGKSRKDRRNCKKGDAVRQASSDRSGDLPDMGALCI